MDIEQNPKGTRVRDCNNNRSRRAKFMKMWSKINEVRLTSVFICSWCSSTFLTTSYRLHRKYPPVAVLCFFHASKQTQQKSCLHYKAQQRGGNVGLIKLAIYWTWKKERSRKQHDTMQTIAPVSLIFAELVIHESLGPKNWLEIHLIRVKCKRNCS